MADDVFDAEWLALRKRADHSARSRSLVTVLRVEGRRRGWSRLVDLGAGTGSNLRYVSGRVPWAKEWILVDHDARLLDRVRAPSHTVRVRTVEGDLATAGLAELADADVVTASALLDLVSEEWLTALRDRCAEAGAAAYFALSYDGMVRWHDSPSPDEDALVLNAVNEHQRRDKGTGAALGPDATDAARRLFEDAGYTVRVEPSPWRLRGRRDAPLAEALVHGWATAALDMRPSDAGTSEGWREETVQRIRSGTVDLDVGHLDLLATP